MTVDHQCEKFLYAYIFRDPLLFYIITRQTMKNAYLTNKVQSWRFEPQSDLENPHKSHLHPPLLICTQGLWRLSYQGYLPCSRQGRFWFNG